jgi:hypothetical protein
VGFHGTGTLVGGAHNETVMTTTPSWKKSFSKGIAKFRNEDLDGALKSFDEVQVIPYLQFLQ